ncbi:mediator of RNA polymerase II transcription subunit 13-like protein, partial [Trifolium pratense]
MRDLKVECPFSKSNIILSVKADQKDAAMLLVLSSHLQLQKEGFLSAWTNSFVGPWDPSQGLHNPDEKIKLWLFLPGRHSSVSETAQPALSGLRVVASGLWVAPGDSEEVAAALSQALRNCIERALLGLYYMRFGDVFSKVHQFQSEELLSSLPSCSCANSLFAKIGRVKAQNREIGQNLRFLACLVS